MPTDAENNIEETLDRISEEDKRVILEDSNQILEALKSRDFEEEEEEWQEKKTDENGESSETFNMNEARKKAKSKENQYRHRLGFHRKYLYPQTKISNVILCSIFIILAIICFVSFLQPGFMPKASI